MKLASMASAFSVAAGLLAGCSGGATGGGTGDTEYVVRDGKAYCVFTGSEREFAVGIIEGDQVKLYATYYSVGNALCGVPPAEAEVDEVTTFS
jgi:hypothetical protein